MTKAHWKYLCIALITLGILGKFYDLNAPWKAKDHYNYGGAVTSSMAECISKTPLSISKGIPHKECWTENPNYYPNHPPTILFAISGWTKIFGTSEAAHRLFILLFSVINIGLVGLIGRIAKPESELFPWLAASMQAIFLGGLYFGTHLDFIGEFTITFTLLSAYAAIRGALTAACLIAILAGITAWPGFLMFGVLFGYTLAIRRGTYRVIAFGVLAFGIAMGMMAWLQQTYNLADFLNRKVAKPGYLSSDQTGWVEPFKFVKNFINSQARLLGPLLAIAAFFELIRGKSKSLLKPWKREELKPLHHAVWLSGGAGLIYAVLGHEYVMVHVFLYLLFTPSLAILAANFFDETIQQHYTFEKADKIWLTALTILLIALYPYGIFKSNNVHDGVNSAILMLSPLALIMFTLKRKLSGRVLAGLIIAAFLGNLSQMINYRNEPDTERSFCEKARIEYERTGQPIKTTARETQAKRQMYCRNIPITYEQ